MPYNNIGLNVILKHLNTNPQCEHGPSVLFESKKNEEVKRFYACSSCRDRKLCGFFIEEKALKSFNQRDKTREESIFFKFYKDHYIKFKKFLTSKKCTKLKFCKSCSKLICPSDKEEHQSCAGSNNSLSLTQTEIESPSLILPPLENSKSEAQYLFNKKCLKVLIQLIKGVQPDKVLCIGTPRIHEALRQEESVLSLLLDIDQRYALFFPPSEVLTYNLFNHYFFGGSDAKSIYSNFLKDCKKLILVSDPPFGGRMELIANTFRIIEEEWREVNGLSSTEKLPIFFIFPYFMEKTVLSTIPSLVMLDYKVDYDNHPLYSKGPKGMKQGSAVRVYVNLPASKFTLPEDEGYWFCEICERWVYENNVHCFKCEKCTSKDGKTYKHCDSCKTCVKPSWIHCRSCKKCFPSDHNCSKANHSKKEFACHMCGANDHKRRDCPKRTDPLRKVKKGKRKKLPRSRTEERAMHEDVLRQIFKRQ